MNSAYNDVKDKRIIIGPNIIFLSQLYDFEKNLADSLSASSTLPPSSSSNNEVLPLINKCCNNNNIGMALGALNQMPVV